MLSGVKTLPLINLTALGLNSSILALSLRQLARRQKWPEIDVWPDFLQTESPDETTFFYGC